MVSTRTPAKARIPIGISAWRTLPCLEAAGAMTGLAVAVDPFGSTGAVTCFAVTVDSDMVLLVSSYSTAGKVPAGTPAGNGGIAARGVLASRTMKATKAK